MMSTCVLTTAIGACFALPKTDSAAKPISPSDGNRRAVDPVPGRHQNGCGLPAKQPVDDGFRLRQFGED